MKDGLQPGEDLQAYNDRVATTTPVGFGDAIDITNTGTPLDTENNNSILAGEQDAPKAEPEVDYRSEVVKQLGSKYDELGVSDYSHVVDTMKLKALESGMPEVISAVDDVTDEARGSARVKLRANYKAGKAKAKADGDLGDYNQAYRDNMRRLSGSIPASEVDDEVIRQLGGWVVDAGEALTSWVYNHAADAIDDGHRAKDRALDSRLDKMKRDSITGIQDTEVDISLGFADEPIILPIRLDGVFVGQMVGAAGIGRVIEAGGAVTSGLAKSLGLSDKVLVGSGATKFVTKTMDKISTSSNLKPLGISANALGGAALTIEEGRDTAQDILIGAAFGAALPAGIEGGVKVAGSIGHTTSRSTDTAVLEKAERLTGATSDDLQVKYREYVVDTKGLDDTKDIDNALANMSIEDKMSVLRKNYDSITGIVRASEGSDATGQNAAQAKSKEQFSAITSKLFSIDHVDGTGPGAIKDAISNQVQDLKSSMVGAIKTAKQTLDEYTTDFNTQFKTTSLDEPINLHDLIEDNMDSMPDKVFDDLTSISIDNSEITHLSQLKEIHDSIQGKGIYDKNGNLLDDHLNTIMEEHLTDGDLSTHLRMNDIQKLHDWLDDTKGISYMFKHDVTDGQIANKLRKIMATDSYAPITKVLTPEQITKVERVALSSLFMKDGVLTEGGRVNFWSLYRDARSINAVSEEMTAVKELMRVYSNHVGTSRLKPNTSTDFETGGKGRDNVASEFASRGIGQIIASIHQFFPTEAGRSTYIYKHAKKLIAGESVPKVTDLSTARLNYMLELSLRDNNLKLGRQGLSPNDIGSLGDSAVNIFGREVDRAGQAVMISKAGNGDTVDFEYEHSDMLTETFKLLNTKLKFDKDFQSGADVFSVSGMDDIARAYPELKDITIHRTASQNSYSHTTKTIYIADNAKNQGDILIHELQHAMQHADGIARVAANPLSYVKAFKSDIGNFADDILVDPKNSEDLLGLVYNKLGYKDKLINGELIASYRKEIIDRLPLTGYIHNANEMMSRLVGNYDLKGLKGVDLQKLVKEMSDSYYADMNKHIDIMLTQPSSTKMFEDKLRRKQVANRKQVLGDARVEYDPDLNSKQFDISNQALKKLITDGRDTTMTPTAIKKYLKGHGVTEAQMADNGINKLLTSNIKPSKLLEKLESAATDIETGSGGGSYKYMFFDNENTPALTNNEGHKIWPDAIDKSTLKSTGYRETILLGDKTNERSVHYSEEENYKSHIITQNADIMTLNIDEPNTSSLEPTTHIVEVQNDLESVVAIDDKEFSAFESARSSYNEAVKEYDELNAIYPEQDTPEYIRWSDDLTSAEKKIEDGIDELNAIKSAPHDAMENFFNIYNELPMYKKQSAIDSRSHITDTNAFIREGLNVAIEKAKQTGSRTVSWPEANVVASRYTSIHIEPNKASGNRKLYVRIYDKQMPKMARKYARAHNLKMPYKIKDVWVLDLESTVKRAKTPEQKEAKNKARMDNLW